MSSADDLQISDLERENVRLRRMLCLARSHLPYMDDGEAHDGEFHPGIDYLRDSVDDIERKYNSQAVQRHEAELARANKRLKG